MERIKIIRKNDKIELFIESVTSEGSGLGRYEGMAVFVRGTVPGDKIIAHIIKVSKNYAIGIVDDIIVFLNPFFKGFNALLKFRRLQAAITARNDSMALIGIKACY